MAATTTEAPVTTTPTPVTFNSLTEAINAPLNGKPRKAKKSRKPRRDERTGTVPSPKSRTAPVQPKNDDPDADIVIQPSSRVTPSPEGVKQAEKAVKQPAKSAKGKADPKPAPKPATKERANADLNAKLDKVLKRSQKTAQAATAEGPSVRLRIFQLLWKNNSNGMTGSAIRDALKLNSVPNILKDEGIVERQRIQRRKVDGQAGVVYSLTPAGRKDLEGGKVDELAAPSAAGKSWPEGR